MAVHFDAEIVPGRREVEDKMEVLAHTLQETVVKQVSLGWILPDFRSHNFLKRKFIKLFSLLVGVFLIFFFLRRRRATNKSRCRLLLLLLDVNES